jgi:hypothetical protein
MNLDRTRKQRVSSFRYQGVSSSEVAYDSLLEGKWRAEIISSPEQKHTATYTATNSFFCGT